MFNVAARLVMLNTEWAQVEVIDLINDGSGLAFGIIGGRSTGVVVKTIIPGGVADRDGRLQSGDHILQIGEVNLRGLGSEQVASVLRQCGVHVRMVVARPVESTSADYQKKGSHAPIVPTKILADPIELERHLNYNGFGGLLMQNPSNSMSTAFIYNTQHSEPQLQNIAPMVDVVRKSQPIGAIPHLTAAQSLPAVDLRTTSCDQDSQPETETYTIDLVKDELGLGITVAGYVCEREEISGIFVKSISKGSAADLTGVIQMNDRIVEVNNVSVVRNNNHEAVEILRKAGSNVCIKFERYLRGPKFEQLQQAILANEYLPISPPSPSASSLPKIPLSLVHMSSLGIEPESESRTSFDFDSGILQEYDAPVIDVFNQIIIETNDGRKSVQFCICSHESILEKWKNFFSTDAQIVIADMSKEPTSGLGISLEGTVDVEDGKEVHPHHYIRNILPHGPVGLNGILQSGDELLEVNGIQLLGLNHLEVVSILKQLPSLVIMVCVRYSIHSRIIDTAQHRDAFQARNILAGSFNTLISPDKLVKAKSDTSIASAGASEPCCSVGSRSKSLELVAGLPMWSTECVTVVLQKADHGLGFSILDYQDPLNVQETVIVIRSLVPGGVAQQDGNLIPGDRLIAVNEIDVAHATLDRAVQVLKGAAKGPVKITVAKPLSGKDAGSYHSQDTEDDQTCLDDFQECIEEYQECLEVVQICIEDDRSPQHRPLAFCGRFPGANVPEMNNKGVSNVPGNAVEVVVDAKPLIKLDSCERTTSKTDSEKDGYETCIDESLSDEMDRTPTNTKGLHSTDLPDLTSIEAAILQMEMDQVSEELHIAEETEQIEREPNMDIQQPILAMVAEIHTKPQPTPSESIGPIVMAEEYEYAQKLEAVEDNNEVPLLRQRLTSTSDPCLNYEHAKFDNHIRLDSNPSDYELKSYDALSTSPKEDEFFLLQYPDDMSTAKCRSEPNVLEKSQFTPMTYRYKIEEYYNDIEECLAAFKQAKIDEEISHTKLAKDTTEQKKESDVLKQTRHETVNQVEFKKPDEQKHLEQDEDGEVKIKQETEDTDLKQSEEQRDKQMQKEDEEEKLSMEEERQRWEQENEERRMAKLKKLGIEKIESTESQDRRDGELMTPCSKRKSAPEILEKSLAALSCEPEFQALATQRNLHYPDDKQERETMIDQHIAESKSAVMRSIGVDSMLGKQWGTPRTVIIHREKGANLGISIVGGKVDLHKDAASETILGIFIKNVVPNSLAGRNGQFQIGDRILEVSGTSLKDASHERAVEIIKCANSPIHFLVQSLITDEAATLALTELPTQKQIDAMLPETLNNVQINNIAPRKQKTMDSSEDSDDEEDERDLTGRTVSAKGQEIDRASAANVKRNQDDADMEEEDDFGYTTDKVKKKYASHGPGIVIVQLERSVGQGLGLSLAGHKDRNCMAVFVCGINPNGAAFRAGGIQVGDEILEVNGVVLHGRCHLNASAIIKGLSGPIFKLIILRRKAAIDDIAVRPITQFPISLAEEASEEAFSNYPNVRIVSIKKGNQSLGIMIIEGKHAEVGQGIFISDVQEGSSAEKAGLEIGEMILAVNKDSLLGSNYDNAANLLKRTEGLVTLVVSNPGRKSASQDESARGLTTGSTTSRPTTPTPEPPADPSTTAIAPGRDTTIEVASDNKALGISFVGGKDTPIAGGIMVVDVYPGGAADKDGRLQSGDQILDVNGTSLKDVTHNFASQALRQTLPKMKIIVHRSEREEYEHIDVEFAKKPGKGLGLSIAARKCGSGKGVYVTEILNGGCVDIDGKVNKGDILVSVNGQNLKDMRCEDVSVILKTLSGKINLKLHRYKPTATSSASAASSSTR